MEVLTKAVAKLGKPAARVMAEWDLLAILNDSPIAIIILNQPITYDSQQLLSLWEKALIRVTVDGGSNRWRSFLQCLPSNIKTPIPPHCVTGDFDSISSDTQKYLKDLQVNFIATPDQDETDFTKALRIIPKMEETLNVKVKYVLCLCEHAGRLDQTLANLETLHHAQSWGHNWSPIILTKNSMTWLLATGKHTIKVPQTFVSTGIPCGLIPLKGPTIVTTNGLKWDVDKCVLQFGTLVSTSNTYSKTNIEVEVSSDLVWTTVLKCED